MKKSKIYVFCPDRNEPSGGVKKLYRHVDILNKNGFSASIVQIKKNFRCTWFKNDTKVSCISNIKIRPSDYLLLPESYERVFLKRKKLSVNRKKRAKIKLLKMDNPKVIFNQNSYYTFKNYSIDKDKSQGLYLQKNTVASIVVSEDNERYLKFAFPGLKVFRVRNSIDPDIFYYDSKKKKQIAFMPRKNIQDIGQVINILKIRNILDNYDLVSIDNLPEQGVAKIMRESLIFLSFGHPEGFGLPPAEAMACGCIVVGYHGMGGREFFKEDFSFPIEFGHIISFSKAVEDVINTYENNPDSIIKMGNEASHFITQTYSPKVEEEDVLGLWKMLIKEYE